jgi:hypothetical protein
MTIRLRLQASKAGFVHQAYERDATACAVRAAACERALVREAQQLVVADHDQPTLTGTSVIVSLPKMSITFTATV